MSIAIRELAYCDIARVAEIHFRELPEDFTSLLGQRFLERVFYPLVFASCCVKLGAVDERDVVQGFIIFSTDDVLYRRLATRDAPCVLRHARWSAFLRLSFLRYLAEVLVLVFTHDDRLRGAEELYLAVAREHQGKWLWLRLFRDGFAALHAQGITHTWLKTLETTPHNIILYERVGYERLKTYLGRVYMTRAITAMDARQ